LQGIKRGIMELADLILVNKSDGDQTNTAKQTKGDYAAALHFMKSRFANWQPQVLACSSTQNKGIEEVWEQVAAFRKALDADGELQQQRAQQARSWMWAETAEALVSDLKSDARVKALVPQLEQAVLDGLLPATVAAQRLIDTFKTNN